VILLSVEYILAAVYSLGFSAHLVFGDKIIGWLYPEDVKK
jgi:hypothetical protein